MSYDFGNSLDYNEDGSAKTPEVRKFSAPLSQQETRPDVRRKALAPKKETPATAKDWEEHNKWEKEFNAKLKGEEPVREAEGKGGRPVRGPRFGTKKTRDAWLSRQTPEQKKKYEDQNEEYQEDRFRDEEPVRESAGCSYDETYSTAKKFGADYGHPENPREKKGSGYGVDDEDDEEDKDWEENDKADKKRKEG